MEYTPQNIMRQHNNWKDITDVGGTDTINDIYIRDPNTSTFWYVGKVSRCTGTVSVEQAVQRQWHLIEQHAARLRQNELRSKYGSLEIWVAPGNTELDVAYNRPNIKFTRVQRPSAQEEVETLRKSIKNAEVGFQGDVYERDEEGFRTERTDDGLPAKPEITGLQNEQKVETQ